MVNNTQSKPPMTAGQANVLIATTAVAAYQASKLASNTSKLVELSIVNNKLVAEQTETIKRIGDEQLDALKRQVLIAESELKRKELERLRKQIIYEFKVELDKLDHATSFKVFWQARVIFDTLNSSNIESSSFDEISDKQYFSDLKAKLIRAIESSQNNLTPSDLDDLNRISSIQTRMRTLHQHLAELIEIKNKIEALKTNIEDEIRKKNADILSFKGTIYLAIISMLAAVFIDAKTGDKANWGTWLFLLSVVLLIYTAIRNLIRAFKPKSKVPEKIDYSENENYQIYNSQAADIGTRLAKSQQLSTFNLRSIKLYINNSADELFGILKKYEIN